jgi:hypothetical protein
MCTVIHCTVELIKVNAQVSNAQNGLAPFTVYSSQSIVRWNTHFLFRKWEMLASLYCANSVCGVSLDACNLPHLPTRHRTKSTNRSEHCLPYPLPLTKLLWCQQNGGCPIDPHICKSNYNAFIELVYNFKALHLYIFCFRSILWRLFTVVYSPVIYSWYYV